MGDLVSAWRSSKLGAAGDKVDFARPVIAATENGRRYCFKKKRKKIRWSLTDKWDP